MEVKTPYKDMPSESFINYLTQNWIMSMRPPPQPSTMVRYRFVIKIVFSNLKKHDFTISVIKSCLYLKYFFQGSLFVDLCQKSTQTLDFPLISISIKKCFIFHGRDIRANIAALWQVKIYPPQKAAATAMWMAVAAIHELPQSTRWNIPLRGVCVCVCVSMCFKKMKYFQYNFSIQGPKSNWLTIFIQLVMYWV